ncbi:hypothetical protein TMM008_45680 [Pseudomonas sp. 008]|nr:hypothetical protein TMM008_45680 [Pseudomonas sp. 008]
MGGNAEQTQIDDGDGPEHKSDADHMYRFKGWKDGARLSDEGGDRGVLEGL